MRYLGRYFSKMRTSRNHTIYINLVNDLEPNVKGSLHLRLPLALALDRKIALVTQNDFNCRTRV